MFIGDITNSGATPALEMAMSFASQRHQLIAGNIANFETPDYRPLDVSVPQFRKVLAEAVDRRRASGSGDGELRWNETREITRGVGGGLRLIARTPGSGTLFHDRNNRDLERTMQDLVENAGAFRVASDLLRSRTDIMRAALAQRV
jgi:flagellar basal-body rod protein FlgB